MLVYQGYSYRFHKDGSAKKIWVCTEERHHDCRGRLHTGAHLPEDGETVEVMKGPGSHNHTPDPASIEKRQVLKVIVLAAASTETTASVVATALEGTSVACLGKVKAKEGLAFPFTTFSIVAGTQTNKNRLSPLTLTFTTKFMASLQANFLKS